MLANSGFGSLPLRHAKPLPLLSNSYLMRDLHTHAGVSEQIAAELRRWLPMYAWRS